MKRSRREAAFLAAAAELEPYRKFRDNPDASPEEKREFEMARMRATRLLDSLAGRGSLPFALERKIQFWMEPER